MDHLLRSDELKRRGDLLRARSVQIHAAADREMEKSRRLIAAAARAREAALRAHGLEPALAAAFANATDANRAWPPAAR